MARRKSIVPAWQRIDATGGPDACWLWTGARSGKGYGTVHGSLPRALYTHRLAWELAWGPIPPGLCVLHRCDNPPCCNPAHLFLGTKAQNSADMVAKGRSARGERQHNARLNEAQVREIRVKRASGERLRALAAEYNVHANTILRVTIERSRPGSWSHVAGIDAP
jgi:hypothetical protein